MLNGVTHIRMKCDELMNDDGKNPVETKITILTLSYIV